MIENLPIVLDGGMGTLLQMRGLCDSETPEDWNIEHPDDVVAIHRAYVEVGSRVVYANTFGANRVKYHGRYSLDEVIHAGLANAHRVKGKVPDVKVALDLGPTGKLLKPIGDLSFDDAIAAYAEAIRIAVTASPLNTPDLIVIETMSDILELKAAVVAAKENSDLPIYVTVTLDENGKLLTGGSVECAAVLLEALGVDAYGFNCGLGPDRMLPFVERLAKVSTKPIIAKPNAGLPKIDGNRTVFTVGPEEFAANVMKLVRAGASIVGGCCGTTPTHIKTVMTKLAACSARVPLVSYVNREGCEPRGRVVVSSGTSVVSLSPYRGLVIGERINPTGKRHLREAYARGDSAYVLREATKQVDAGAVILDINCGVPGLDERTLLDATVRAVQEVATCPVQIDTADPVALECALRRVNGKPLVNSVNGTRESMDAVFPIVKKYGGVIVALCLDENGIPATSEGRLAIARRILAEGAKFGFAKSDFAFDALTLAVSSDPNAAVVTLETVRRLTDELGVNTVLGVSNVSFGLPNRGVLNNTMYALAKRAGLSAAIANPAMIRDEIDLAAKDVLLGRDVNCARWIESNRVEGGSKTSATASTGTNRSKAALDDANLGDAIKKGLRKDAQSATEAMLKSGTTPLEIVECGIVPALEEIGCGFERGTVFLPQLLMVAEAAGAAFAAVKETMRSGRSGDGCVSGAPVILATVKGDVHDIGKNIVRALLENYGFDVIDLGRDVAPEAVVKTARQTGAMLVGLSALMTTTIGAMAETVRLLKATGLSCKTVVGGAVVTQEYADSIGADFYAKDAMRTVRIAESLAKRSEGRV